MKHINSFFQLAQTYFLLGCLVFEKMFLKLVVVAFVLLVTILKGHLFLLQ